jgi:hypothetical protein
LSVSNDDFKNDCVFNVIVEFEPVKLSTSSAISAIPTVSCGFSLGGDATVAEAPFAIVHTGLPDTNDIKEKSSSSGQVAKE